MPYLFNTHALKSQNKLVIASSFNRATMRRCKTTGNHKSTERPLRSQRELLWF